MADPPSGRGRDPRRGGCRLRRRHARARPGDSGGGPGELAQWVVPTRDGLSVIQLVLAAEAPDLPGDVVIRIEALAEGAAADNRSRNRQGYSII